jgi:hypothetical protein
VTDLGYLVDSAPSAQEDLLDFLRDSLGPMGLEDLLRDALALRRIRRAKLDPNAFIEYVAKDPNGRPFTQADFHRELQAFIPLPGENQHEWFGLICFPRNHGKSDQMVYRDIWELGTNPNLRLKIVSATDGTSIKILNAIKGNITSNERVREVFPDLKPGLPWGGTSVNVAGASTGEKEYSIEATSITSTAAGGRADFMHFDDVCDQENAISKPNLREKIAESFNQVWINLLCPGGRVPYLYTPWHQEDISSRLEANPIWNKIKRPAIREEKGERVALWPAMFPLETLDIRKKAIGDAAFTRNFMLRPIADEDIIFTDDVLCPSIMHHWAYGSKEYEDFIRPFQKVMGVDLGASMGAKSSYTVLFTLAIGPDNRLWIADIHRGRWHPHEVDGIILAKHRVYLHQLVIVEDNAYQSHIVGSLEQRMGASAMGIPVAPFTTTSGKKQSLQVGPRGMAVTMSHGGFGIPTGHLSPDLFDPASPGNVMTLSQDTIERDPILVWLKELVEWPTGSYSDTVMASWFSWWGSGYVGYGEALEEASASVA